MGKNKSTRRDGVNNAKLTQELESSRRMPLGVYRSGVKGAK